MRTFGLLARVGVLLFSFAAFAAEPPPLFTLTDPRGDDHGDGALVYPLRNDMHPGDLDLVSVTARPDPDGTMFELTFAQPIVRPTRRPIDAVGATLDAVATMGFYTFNVDLYIDTDRVPGSGLVSTLPGRLAELDSANAWEKAICLTPRGAFARSALRRMTRSALLKELQGGGGQPPKGSLEDRVFFPTRARVLGSTISFVVPTAFLGGQAKPTWSYVVVVTGADIRQRLDVQSFGLFVDESNTGNLAVIPLAGGPSEDRFGGIREGDPLEPPIVDLIAPPGRIQEQLLKDDDPKTHRLVRLPGVVPAGEPAPAPAPSAVPPPGDK